MQRIGLFGGTFNPIHMGHLRLATAFVQSLCLDKLIVIPDYMPPHKDAKDLASAVDRYNMCRVAVAGIPNAEVSDYELRRETESYTVHTLQHFNAVFPDAELFFIMGSDMFVTLEEWYDAKTLFTLATMCAGARNLGEYRRLVEYADMLTQKGVKTCVVDIEPYAASSTDIREGLRRVGGARHESLPESVCRYIDTVRPYGGERADVLLYKQEIAARLSAQRYEHSVCVAKEAVTLSILFGADENKAYIAGLLHDIAKEMPQDEQLQMVQKSGIILDGVEQKTPKLWHSILGAQLVRSIGINDEQIINAIRYHTTAREGSTLLEQVVYLADWISFERSFKAAQTVRERIAFGLDSAMLCALSASIAGLAKRECSLHIDTVMAYNSFLPAE